MKRFYLIVAATLMMGATLILTFSQSPTQRAQTGPTVTIAKRLTIEKQVSTQQRINRYFHSYAMAKIKSCWGNVQGNGTISMKHIYTKSGERWSFAGVDVEKSTLPSDQTKVALRCMSDSLRGSSFPVELTDSTLQKFVLNWSWPVPFPTNAQQLTSAMFAAKPSGGGGSSSGGCDGNGAAPKCYMCSDATAKIECKAVCVGWETCTIVVKGNETDCNPQTSCASGGPFGVFGGSRMY